MTEILDRSRQFGSAHSFVEGHLVRNFVALALDYGFFGLAMSLASTTTILPALADRLGAPNVVLGALPSIVMLGRSVPALFSARLVESMQRRLPFVLTYTAWERLPWLVLAVAVYGWSTTNPTLVLALLVATLAIVALVGGILSPAWVDLIARVIPTDFRGRFFAVGGTVSTLLGLGGSVLSGFLLREYAFPMGYSLCIAAAFLCLIASWGALAVTLEPAAAAPKSAMGLSGHLARLPGLLRGNPPFAWYLAARALTMIGTMATGFYTVYAIRSLGAQEWNVASFTFALLAAQAAGGLALGSLSDRMGHRASLVVGIVANAAAGMLAITSTNLILYHAVFMLTGISVAANNVSSQTLVLEMAPEQERPTYLGLSSTVVAPFILVAPVLAGTLADSMGLKAVFGAAALLSAASAATYLLRVTEPRRLLGG
jgi:MFS family permease